MKPKSSISLSCLLGLIARVAIASSETTDVSRVGSIPYLAVYRLAYQPDTTNVTNEIEGFVVESRSHDINPKEISLFIDRKTGRVPIALTGGFFDLPVSDSLRAENPPIISNQTKGTLSLSYYLGARNLAVPENRTLTYRDLVKSETSTRTMETIIEATNVVQFSEVMYLRIRDHGRSNIVIRSMARVVEISGGGDGFYEIPLRSDFMGENPDVVLPGRTAWFVEGCGFTAPRKLGYLPHF